MRIACKECNSVYSIAEKIIGFNGRIVKCAKCSHSWMVHPVVQDTCKPNNSISNSKNSSNNVLKILVLLFVFINSIIFLLFFSETLVEYKPFKLIYEKFSIHNSNGLTLEDLKFETYDNEIIINGMLSNFSNEDRITPDIRYTLLNADKKIIFSFTIPSSQHILKSNESWPINTEISNIKHNAVYLQVDIGNKLDLLLR